jgi:LPXTG-motif cell wall-anchored protein
VPAMDLAFLLVAGLVGICLLLIFLKKRKS